jgi:hypothetical protein
MTQAMNMQNVHAVEARTNDDMTVVTPSMSVRRGESVVFENVHAVEARAPF